MRYESFVDDRDKSRRHEGVVCNSRRNDNRIVESTPMDEKYAFVPERENI
jgi:hypothetical protein